MLKRAQKNAKTASSESGVFWNWQGQFIFPQPPMSWPKIFKDDSCPRFSVAFHARKSKPWWMVNGDEPWASASAHCQHKSRRQKQRASEALDEIAKCFSMFQHVAPFRQANRFSINLRMSSIVWTKHSMGHNDGELWGDASRTCSIQLPRSTLGQPKAWIWA